MLIRGTVTVCLLFLGQNSAKILTCDLYSLVGLATWCRFLKPLGCLQGVSSARNSHGIHTGLVCELGMRNWSVCLIDPKGVASPAVNFRLRLALTRRRRARINLKMAARGATRGGTPSEYLIGVCANQQGHVFGTPI